MRIEHIRYFIKAAGDGSISRASKDLNLTRQNLGKILAGMEKELGISLVDRDRWGITLTRQGKVVYEKFVEIDKAYGEILSYASAEKSVKNIDSHAMAIYMASNTLPQAFSNTLKRLVERYPDLDLSVLECKAEDAIAGLFEGGDAYANIVYDNAVKRGDIEARGLRVLLNRTIEYLVYLPVSLGDRVRGGGLDVKELARVPLVQYACGDFTDDFLLEGLSRYVDPAVKHRTNNIVIFNDLLASGEFGTISVLYAGQKPLADKALSNSVYRDRPFMRVPLLCKGKPIQMQSTWCCRGSMIPSEPGSYLMKLL